MLTDEIIDTRQLIERAEEIRAELAEPDLCEDPEAYAEELAEIEAIEEAGIPDFPYGETLIREDYFQTYAQELAADIGALADESAWPLSYIDWEAAADALKVDYIEVEYQGSTYYARA
jgi:hypothetical protein